MIKKVYFCCKKLENRNMTKILEILAYTLPSLITGGVAYSIFISYFKDQQNTRRWLIQKENQKLAFPQRIQAYERMVLFLERINPTKMLLRVAPISQEKSDYENLIISQIEQEFEHNLTQQLYLSDASWTIILTAKNSTIQMIRKVSRTEDIVNADAMREKILNDLLDKQSPSNAALAYLKNEVSELW
ncbi:hypothetical protein FVB9288_01568 [Flavobacterium sp. CECT 9288]|jgi:hypothetical protein|nr:hypothetical protein FVB9288_01568 [Flavobacterium sp. CECT 9288]